MRDVRVKELDHISNSLTDIMLKVLMDPVKCEKIGQRKQYSSPR